MDVRGVWRAPSTLGYRRMVGDFSGEDWRVTILGTSPQHFRAEKRNEHA